MNGNSSAKKIAATESKLSDFDDLIISKAPSKITRDDTYVVDKPSLLKNWKDI